MASIKVRLDRLETRYGACPFEDMVRRMPTETLDVLASLYALLTAGQADEATLAEIEAVEARYR